MEELNKFPAHNGKQMSSIGKLADKVNESEFYILIISKRCRTQNINLYLSTYLDDRYEGIKCVRSAVRGNERNLDRNNLSHRHQPG